jgi:hypothetical protein
MPDFLPDNIGAFLLVTVVLGGGAAWLAGRALAQTWRPWWQGIVYMLVLGAAVRFIHFALFDGTLLSLPGYAVDTAVAMVFAGLGFRITRAQQMARQYGFLAAVE